MRWFERLDRPFVWLSVVPLILLGFQMASAAEPQIQPPIQPPISVAPPVFVELPPADTVAIPAGSDSQAAGEPSVPPLPPLSCDNTHTAEPGDSWWQIADRADVDPWELLDLNRADPDTMILIGDDVCLPTGAIVSPPSSTTTTTLDPAPILNAPESITSPATATSATSSSSTATATRIEPSIQATDTFPPPTTVPTGLHGLPFAPDGLDRCDEMQFYRVQAGLIEQFDGVGFRESSCRNDVSSFCCHGFWQLYVTVHVRDHRLGPRYAECGIETISDVLGDEPIKKQRNACGARAVYEISGGGAWDAW